VGPKVLRTDAISTVATVMAFGSETKGVRRTRMEGAANNSFESQGL
jgi:hypothetical protein